VGRAESEPWPVTLCPPKADSTAQKRSGHCELPAKESTRNSCLLRITGVTNYNATGGSPFEPVQWRETSSTLHRWGGAKGSLAMTGGTWQ